MKIIYEIRDLVELDDDIRVPHNLGASFVKLIRRDSTNLWIVEVIEGPHCDKRFHIDEKWFNPS